VAQHKGLFDTREDQKIPGCGPEPVQLSLLLMAVDGCCIPMKLRLSRRAMPVLQGGDWVQASDESMEELIEIMRKYEKLTQKLKKVETLG
jgi:hypothetical protein